VDFETPVRSGRLGTSERRFVRYDCSGRSVNENGLDAGASCVRYEGDPVPYPPPPNAPMEKTHTLITGTQGLDILHPQSVDPVTGATKADFLAPHLLTIRFRIRADEGSRVIEIRDGVSLRNVTRYEG
jgi:hypothetical protein